MSCEEAFNHLCVDVDPGYAGVERRCSEIKESSCARSNENDPPVDIFARDLPGEHFPRGNILGLIEMAKFQIETATGVGRGLDLSPIRRD